MRLVHTENEVDDIGSAVLVANELGLDTEYLLGAQLEHPGLQLGLVTELVRSRDHLHELSLIVLHHLRSMLTIQHKDLVFLRVEGSDRDVSRFEGEVIRVLLPLLNHLFLGSEHVIRLNLLRCAHLDNENQIVVFVVRALGDFREFQVFDVSEVDLVAEILFCLTLKDRHQG